MKLEFSFNTVQIPCGGGKTGAVFVVWPSLRFWIPSILSRSLNVYGTVLVCDFHNISA